jgi:heat shock protein HtpX
MLAGREKMKGALRRLASNVEMVDHTHESLATLKILGKQGGLMALLSTHPPLAERIRRLG